MNLMELFVKIGVEDKASAAIKNTGANAETLGNKIQVMSAKFDKAQKEVEKLTKEFNEATEKMGAASTEAQELAAKLDKAERAAANAKTELDRYNDELGQTSKKAEEARDKLDAASVAVGTFLSSFAMSAVGEIVDGLKRIAEGIVNIAKESLTAYADTQQLVGGVEKIFDQMDNTRILRDAEDAYKDLGLSVNQYLSMINDVGAAFAATMGDEKGYETAKAGLKAISDYASGTGRNVDELSGKFTLITRSTASYQSIADQFSGILPATSRDFLAQAKAAGILSESYTELTQVPINEYQEAVAAMLEKGVEALGLAGNTAEEAATTISGSLAMVRAARDNLLAAFGDPEADIGPKIDAFVDSIMTAADNIIPQIPRILDGISRLFDELIPALLAELPGIIEEVAPKAIELFTGLAITVAETFSKPEIQSAMREAGLTVLKTLFTGMVDVSAANIDVAKETIGSVLAGIQSFFQDLWDKGSEAIGKFIGGIVSRFEDIKTQGGELVLNILTGIANLFIDLFNKGGEIVDQVKSGFAKKGELAKEWGADLISNFIGGIKETWDNLKEAVTNVAQSIADRLGFSEPKLGPLSNFHTYAPDMMMLFAQGIRDNENLVIDASEAVAGKVNTALSGAGQGVSLIADFGHGTPSGQVANALTFDAQQAGMQIYELLTVGMAETEPTLFEYITDLHERLVELLESFYDSYRMIGRSFMDGIAQGVSEGRSGVVNAIAAVLAAAVAEAQSQMDIHSPSRVFAKIGKQMIDGVRVGWTQGTEAVTRLVGDSLSTMAAAPAIATGQYASSTMNTSSYTYGDINMFVDHINGSSANDARALLEMMEFERRQQIAGRGIV